MVKTTKRYCEQYFTILIACDLATLHQRDINLSVLSPMLSCNIWVTHLQDQRMYLHISHSIYSNMECEHTIIISWLKLYYERILTGTTQNHTSLCVERIRWCTCSCPFVWLCVCRGNPLVRAVACWLHHRVVVGAKTAPRERISQHGVERSWQPSVSKLGWLAGCRVTAEQGIPLATLVSLLGGVGRMHATYTNPVDLIVVEGRKTDATRPEGFLSPVERPYLILNGLLYSLSTTLQQRRVFCPTGQTYQGYQQFCSSIFASRFGCQSLVSAFLFYL